MTTRHVVLALALYAAGVRAFLGAGTSRVASRLHGYVPSGMTPAQSLRRGTDGASPREASGCFFAVRHCSGMKP